MFSAYKDDVEDGDMVLGWMTRTAIKPMVVEKSEGLFNTRYGAFPHRNMHKYGSQVGSMSKQGFIHLIHPTPELWSLSLPHRTQIVYTPDSSYIVQRLKIRPGSVVIESGTGSGSFTHAVSRTVAATGHVYSYEFHEERFEVAKQEFADHQLDNVTITHRDVCLDGFANPRVQGVPPLELNGEGKATAVFLDLPAPWTAIPHLEAVIDRNLNSRVCCFSPCFEQVVKAVTALQESGWVEIEMVEVSAKRWESRLEMKRSMDEAITRLRDVKQRRENGLAKRNARIVDETGTDSEPESKKARVDSETDMGTDAGTDADASSSKPSLSSKNRGYNPWGKGMKIREGDESFEWIEVSKMEQEIKSHTSYLLFATKLAKLDENVFDKDMCLKPWNERMEVGEATGEATGEE